MGRYFDVFQSRKMAKFLIAKKLPVDYDPNDPMEWLRSVHEEAIREYYALEEQVDRTKRSLDDLETPKKSYLDLKVDIANRMHQNCHFCVRRCGVDRSRGELGWCKAGFQFLLSSMFEHVGEEPELVPSGTIFTIGCNLKCMHCQNWTISQRLEDNRWCDFAEDDQIRFRGLFSPITTEVGLPTLGVLSGKQLSELRGEVQQEALNVRLVGERSART